jgi:hypothetical protein
VATSRNERLIENERLFRTANEALREAVEPVVAHKGSIPFFCECIEETCMARLELTLEDYNRVRAYDDQFVVIPGHPLLDGERILEESDGFLIVTKEGIQ